MVCPGEQGAQSQRRLNHISERLWDYQLRGIGACSILFSWGGVQVQDQPLAEAIASATERMRETKRTAASPLTRIDRLSDPIPSRVTPETAILLGGFWSFFVSRAAKNQLG